MKIERKYFELEAKQAGIGDDGAGWISGYANVKNIVDRVGDRVLDGAYKYLDRLVKEGWGSVSHDWDESICTVEEAKEDATGLWVKLAFHSDEDSQKIRTRCKERIDRGKSVFFSIGYETIDAAIKTEAGEDVRDLKAIYVREIAIVMAPANESSEADGIKDLFGSGARSPLEAKLNGAILAVADAAEHFKSHADMKGQTGRRINPEKVAKAKELHFALGSLIESCEEKQETNTDEVLAVESRWLEMQARAAGLIA